jgi:hypothetical protein
VLLAELSGSSILARLMRELTPLTCLAILTFEAPTAVACPNDEHSLLIDAIEARDPEDRGADHGRPPAATSRTPLNGQHRILRSLFRPAAAGCDRC